MADPCSAAPWRGNRHLVATLIACLVAGGSGVLLSRPAAATDHTPSPGFSGAMGQPTIAPGGAGHQRIGEPAGDAPDVRGSERGMAFPGEPGDAPVGGPPAAGPPPPRDMPAGDAPGAAPGVQRRGADAPPGFEREVGIDSGVSPGGSGPSGIIPPPQADTAPAGADPLSE